MCGVNIGISNLARFEENTPEATKEWFEFFKAKFVRTVVKG
jgi:hypothetical protein